MPIKRVGKYLESDDLGNYPSLGIESSLLKPCIREIRRRKIPGVFGCPAFGFKEQNLDFLNAMPFVRQVWFWEVRLDSIDGLNSLDQLEYFGVHDVRPGIDFSHFTRLKKAVWHPVDGDWGLEKLPVLTELDMWRFKPSTKRYSDFKAPASLKKLALNWCNPHSLEGLPKLPNLLELQVHYCKNLRSLDGLLSAAPKLQRLVITRCPNLKDYSIVEGRSWEKLFINVRGRTLFDI